MKSEDPEEPVTFPSFEDDIDGISSQSHMDDNMASNNWVISGKLTKTGLPLLASDPHLGTSLPSIWSINHIEFK